MTPSGRRWPAFWSVVCSASASLSWADVIQPFWSASFPTRPSVA
jgi:hypothetical protein